MSSSGFSFPPPPPPPPQSSGTNFAATNPGQQRGGWGSRNNFRGHGRGSGHWGGGRGGHMKGYGHRGGSGAARGSHPPMHSNLPHYNNPSQPAYSTHSSGISPAAAQSSSFAPQHTPYVHQQQQQQQQQQQHNAAAASHWGFQGTGPQGFARGSLPAQPHGHRGGFTTRGQNAHFGGPQKRPHQNAFANTAQKNAPRPSAPLPVPSFGNPLPSKPPVSAPETGPKPAKKKRRTHNQLGLTPQTEDHESSEEDDVDEEVKLAAKAPAGVLKINYKGRISTLRSQEDIAKWIEERKQRFPTQARVDERIKEAEAKKAERETIRREKEAAREEAKRSAKAARAKKDKEKQDKKEGDASTAAATKAELRAQKLRSKLQKQEMKVAKAEAKVAKAKSLSEKPGHGHATNGENLTTTGSVGAEAEQTNGKTETLDDVKTGESDQKADGKDESAQGVTDQSPKPDNSAGPALDDIPRTDLGIGMENLVSDGSEDETSSSGSDISSSDDSDSDDDSLPEEITSKRQQPDRVLPPPRQDPRHRRVCHQYAKTGHCRRGAQCKYLHQKSDGETQKPSQKKSTAALPEKRKSLFQTLLAQQREDENKRIMEAISWLGERGVLDEPTQDSAS